MSAARAFGCCGRGQRGGGAAREAWRCAARDRPRCGGAWGRRGRARAVGRVKVGKDEAALIRTDSGAMFGDEYDS